MRPWGGVEIARENDRHAALPDPGGERLDLFDVPPGRRAGEMSAGDSTASWNYSSGTIRASNNDTDNSASAFCGLAEERVVAKFRQNWSDTVARGQAAELKVGIGWNSTSAYSGHAGRVTVGAPLSGIDANLTSFGEYEPPPFLGRATVTSLESASAVAADLRGGENDCLLTVSYQG